MRRMTLALAVVLVLGACAPDPTTGRPPTDGAIPAFHSAVHAVGPGTSWPLDASWRAGCPVGPDRLRLVEVSHWGYDGTARTGRIVVNAAVAADVVDVFRRLYAARFQIARMEPVDAFGGSDDASMAANNTSGFNCRRVAGTSTWSQHAYGLAIDVNPVQNPYINGSVVEPPAGSDWVVRIHETPGMIRDGDAVVTAFAAGGFRWGGHWATIKDYQHFSTTGR